MDVGVRDLRDHLSHYLQAVQDGQEIIVTDHGRAVARLVPTSPSALDRLISEGRATPARNPKRKKLPSLMSTDGNVSDFINEQRR